MKDELAQAVAVTAELTGTNLSEAAAEMLVTELAGYDRMQVLGALRQCRMELKGRLTMAAIIERLDDGRPGPEEAFAMLPKSEAESVVWTTEMSQAFGVCVGLMDSGDMVAARMAFKESYQRLVTQSRNQRLPAKWMPSLGFDPLQREGALQLAVEKNRITLEHANRLVPHLEAPSQKVLNAISGLTAKLIEKNP